MRHLKTCLGLVVAASVLAPFLTLSAYAATIVDRPAALSHPALFEVPETSQAVRKERRPRRACCF